MCRLITFLCLGLLLTACSTTGNKGFTAVNPDIDLDDYIAAPKQPDRWSFDGLRNDVFIHKSEQTSIKLFPQYADNFLCGGVVIPEYSGAIWRLDAVRDTNYTADGHEIYIPINDLIPEANRTDGIRYFYFSFEK